MNQSEILTPRETEQMLGLPRGRVIKLARSGQIPHVVIPATGKNNAEIRFLRSVVESWLRDQCGVTTR